MEPEYDMEVTPERANTIKERLIQLLEDQMGCKLIVTVIDKGKEPAQAGRGWTSRGDEKMFELITLERALELYEQYGIAWLINDGQFYPMKERKSGNCI